jgi:hypothetical protein
MKYKTALTAAALRGFAIEAFDKYEDPEFTRFKKLLYGAAIRAAFSGKHKLSIKVRNKRNLPSAETYNKLTAYFSLKGFKFFGNNDALEQTYLTLVWS